ncbi:hypothetical protein [Marinovum sp.]|uniref:hypothetical protein n=1 Tax=Marinovum sp. TaxID=2024839 RepID=UPI003A9237C3
MKLGYLFIPPGPGRITGPGRGPGSDRSGLAAALGFSEFYSEDTQPRFDDDPHGAPLLRILPDRPPATGPRLASVDGVPRRGAARTPGPLAAPASCPEAIRTQSRQGHLPLSACWADTDTLAQHWAAHVTGSTHGARCARRTDWRITRTVVVDDDPARAEALVKAPGSPCRTHFAAQMPGADAATLEARLDACVLFGTAAQVMAQLDALQAALDGFGTLVLADHPWADAARARRSMVLFADAVLQTHQSHTQRKLRKLELA